MSKKKKKTGKRRFPWLFLSILTLFCLWLTYLWGVFYIPSLPREEVPPFLLTQTESGAPDSQTERTDPPTVPDRIVTDKIPDDTAKDRPAVTQTQTAVTERPDTPAPVVQTGADVYARRPGVYNILCAGRDDAAYNTDVLLLVSLDAGNNTAAVVQIPRDTYLDGGKANALWAKKRTAAKFYSISISAPRCKE
jgi:hypothetical protein